MGMERSIQWVFSNSQSTRGARFVLSYLAFIANDLGEVLKSINEMSEQLNLSRQSVSSALKRLVALGDILPIVKDGRSMVYRLACYSEDGEFIGVDSKEAA